MCPSSAESLPAQVVSCLTSAGHTLAVAESCTGGMIGAAVTDVAGASAVFLGGAIAYANHVKQSVLGVPAGLLASQGAVCAEVAAAMAEGAARLTGASHAVAVTGIAGPGGGSAEKPVGLVYIAVAAPGRTETFEHRFDGDRGSVRRQTVEAALGHVLNVLR